jgi:predicted dehydrogenase
MTNLAIIGAGSIAEFQIPAFRAAGFRISGAASSLGSTTIASFCNKHKIKNYFTDPEKLISSKDWDALYLSMPTNYSLEYLDLLKNEKRPILIEKPVSFSSYELLKRSGFTNVRVGYNRRFYDGVDYVKKFLESSNEVLVKVCIPESSFYPDIFKNKNFYLPPLTFENSTHIFDLINYLCGKIEWQYGKLSQQSNNKFPKFIIGNGLSSNGHNIVLDIIYDCPTNFSLEFLTDTDHLVLRPLEVMHHYQGIEIREPTHDLPFRTYQPKIFLSIKENNYHNLKPGLLGQAKAFYDFFHGEKDTRLATLSDAAISIKTIEDLLRHLT